MLIRAGGALLALLVLAAIAYVVISRVRDDDGAKSLTGVQTFKYTANQHKEGPLTYKEVPPVGGEHNPVWQNCGYYAAPIANENAVHSLEHGAVWITYRPDLPADQVETLRQLAEGQTYILVSPYPDLPAPVVASAWNTQLRLTAANDPGLDSFVKTYRQGPQTPERRASCTGGTSATR